MNDILTRFENAISKNRLSHLYLLSGSKGHTKKHLVKEIAYLILKEENDNPNLKRLLDSDSYHNFLYIEKEGLSVKKEQILELQREFSKTSLVSGSRIYVIDDAETMSQSAANSLLKFLEEPKDNLTIGFLLVDDLNLILPTIRSRAQVVLVEGNKNDLIERLTLNQIDIKHATFISLLTDDYEEALSIYNDQQYLPLVNIVDELTAWLINPNDDYVFFSDKLLANLGVDKKYYEYFFTILSNILLDAIHLHVNQKIDMDFLRETLLSIVRVTKLETLEQLIKLIQDMLKELRYSLNLSLALSSFMIRLKDVYYND